MDPDRRDEAGAESGLHGMEGVHPSIQLQVVLVDDLISDCETTLRSKQTTFLSVVDDDLCL